MWHEDLTRRQWSKKSTPEWKIQKRIDKELSTATVEVKDCLKELSEDVDQLVDKANQLKNSGIATIEWEATESMQENVLYTLQVIHSRLNETFLRNVLRPLNKHIAILEKVVVLRACHE